MSALLWIAILMGIIYAYSQLWARQTAGQIRLTFQTHERVLIDGDETEFWLTMENFSWLPIPWVEVSQQLPVGLLVQDGEKWKETLTFSSFLLPRQRVQRRYLIRCVRGLHKFDKAEVQYGDGLGMQDVSEAKDTQGSAHEQGAQPYILQEMTTNPSGGMLVTNWSRKFSKKKRDAEVLQGEVLQASFTQLLVRPRVLDAWELPLQLTELVGDQSVVRWFQEDASRLQGVRSYMLGDPYKHIHWAATARTGDLMVKQFETTSETEFYILINGQFIEPYWAGTNRAIVNMQARLAATLFEQVDADGFLYGLYSNAGWAGIGGLQVPLGRGPGQLDMMMAALGGMLYRSSGPFAELLLKLRGRLGSRSTVAILTAYWDEHIAAEVEHLRGEGHNILLLAFPRIADHLYGLHPSVPVVGIDAEELQNETLDESFKESLEEIEVVMPDLAAVTGQGVSR